MMKDQKELIGDLNTKVLTLEAELDMMDDHHKKELEDVKRLSFGKVQSRGKLAPLPQTSRSLQSMEDID